MIRRGISLTIALLLLSAAAQAHASNMIDLAKKAVRQELRDPDSLRIISAAVIHTTNLKGEPLDIVCGTLAARNGFGGMSSAAGYIYIADQQRAFIVDGSIILNPDEARLADMIYGRFCP